MPLQRKTQCLWQTKIAKVLWHQKSHVFPKTVSQSPNSACAEFGNQTAGSIGVRSTARRKRAYYPRILPCRILGFWHKAVAQVSLILSHKNLPGLEHKPPAMRKPNQDSSIKFRRTVPEFGESRILEFCAFAEKNAVSLANQGCKGSQNAGRNDRLWHLKSSDLSKAVSQSPEFSLR